MRDVAGVDDECGLHGQRVDPLDGQLERVRDVIVSGLIEADVAVADLDEVEGPGRNVGERGRAQRSHTREGKGDTGAGPADVVEKVATFHVTCTFLRVRQDDDDGFHVGVKRAESTRTSPAS